MGIWQLKRYGFKDPGLFNGVGKVLVVDSLLSYWAVGRLFIVLIAWSIVAGTWRRRTQIHTNTTIITMGH